MYTYKLKFALDKKDDMEALVDLLMEHIGKPPIVASSGTNITLCYHSKDSSTKDVLDAISIAISNAEKSTLMAHFVKLEFSSTIIS